MDDINRDDDSDSLSLAGSVTSMQLEDKDGPLRIEGGRDDDHAVLDDVPEFYKHREAFEELQARQYWKPEWRMQVDLDRPFSLSDHSTLAPSLDRAQKGSPLGIFGAAAHEVRGPQHSLVIGLTAVVEIHPRALLCSRSTHGASELRDPYVHLGGFGGTPVFVSGTRVTSHTHLRLID